MKQSFEPTAICQNASNFCFHLEEDDDGDTCVFFCPLSHFRENSKMPEEICDALDSLVPSSMDEIGINCYSTMEPSLDVEKKLLGIGFVKDEEFSKFMENIEEFEED